MNINKGLVLDGTTLDSESGAWNDARNIILTKNKQSVQNEPGFEIVGHIESEFTQNGIIDTYIPFKITGSLIGSIELPNSIITFYKNDNSLFIYNDDILIMQTSLIPCDINTPIFGTYMINYKGEINIVWANGVLATSDVIRYMNIDTPQFTLSEFKTLDSELECDKTVLQTKLYSSDIKINMTPGKGSLYAGSYAIAYAFVIDNYNETQYTTISNMAYTINNIINTNLVYAGLSEYPFGGVKKDGRSTCRLDVNILIPEVPYSHVNIAILYYNGTTTIVKKLKNVKLVTSDEYGYRYTAKCSIGSIDTLDDFTLDELLLSINRFDKCNTMTNINNKLVLGGVSYNKNNELLLQTAANKIMMICNINKFVGKITTNTKLRQTFHEGEVYAFYVGYKSKHGGYLSICHIPGLAATANTPSVDGNALQSVSNASESYNNSFPNYAGQQVRHHVMPSFKECFKAPRSRFLTCGIEVYKNVAGSYVNSFNSYNYLYTLYTAYGTNNNSDDDQIVQGSYILNGNLTSGEFIINPQVTPISITGMITIDSFDYIPNSKLRLRFIATQLNVINFDNDVSVYTEAEYTPISVIFDDSQNIYRHSYYVNYVNTIPVAVGYILDSKHTRLTHISGVIKIKDATPEPTITAIDGTKNISYYTPVDDRKFQITVTPKNIIIPVELRDICIGVDIFCAKRTAGNSRVIDSDLIQSRLWSHFRQYGNQTMWDPTSGNDMTDLYHEGHALSLMQSKLDVSAIKYIEIVAMDMTNSDVAAIVGNHKTYKIKPTCILPTPILYNTFELQYLQNNNATHNNLNGDSCIRIKFGQDTFIKNKLPPLYSGGNLALMDIQYYINYLSNIDDFYTDYIHQDLLKLGSISEQNGIYFDTPILGDDFRYVRTNHIKKLYKDTDPIPLETVAAELATIYQRILFYDITSSYNLLSVYEGIETYEALSHDSTDYYVYSILSKYDDFTNTSGGFNPAFNKRNDFYTTVFNSDDISIQVDENIIAVSKSQTTEGRQFNWRYFPTNAYRIIDRNRGKIVQLTSDNKRLYIQCMYSLYIATIKDVLSLKDGTNTYLGSGDIFDRDPEEITDEVFGSFGCQHKYAITLNKFGYFAVDAMKGKIFNISNEKLIISNIGGAIYFKNTLSNISIDNPYIGMGISLHTDEYNDRLILINNNAIDKFLSYDLQLKIWIAKHDYKSLFITTNRNGLYQYVVDYLPEKTISCFKQSLDSNFGQYGYFIYDDDPLADININPLLNTRKASYVDVLFTDKQLNRILQSVAWKTEINKGGIKTYKETIDFIMAYTNTQCTGIIRIKPQNTFFDTKTALLKNDIWYFNELFDNVIVDTTPIFDDFKQPTNNVNKAAKAWYNTSKLISDGFIIRFGISYNIRPEKVVLHMIDIISTTDNR